MLEDAPIRLFQTADAGGPQAMVPLCRASGPFARWRMPGAEEVFEPGDALCRDAEAARRLAQLLANQDRPIDLARIPATSPLVPALKTAVKGRGVVSVRPATPCPTIALSPEWLEPESRFSSRRRSDFRRAARRAAEFGSVCCETLAPTPAEFDALFDEAIAIEAKSWKLAAGTAIACDPAKEAFFRRYLRAACARGEGRIAFLRIDGRAVAMQLAVEWAGRYWLYKIGYDEAYGRCSPGTLLMLHARGEAARRNLASFELMGDAEAWIADLWTRDVHECVRVRTYPYNAAGFAAGLRDSVTWARGRWKRKRRGGRSLRARLRDARYALPKLVERHVKGEDAPAAARHVVRFGLPVSAGYFASEGTRPSEVAETYVRLAAEFARSDCDVVLALKAPQLGFDEALVQAIAAAGLPMVFDSLTAAHAEGTLRLAETFAAGAALPARWQRSVADAERLRDGDCGVRLVKGEWADPAGDVRDVDEAYRNLAQILAGRRSPVGVATHDPVLADATLRILLEAGTPCELEQLRGLPRRRSMAVARKLGVPVRLYYPFGPGWWPYAVDKALARPYLPLWALRDLVGG
jgi:hypothetical protein